MKSKKLKKIKKIKHLDNIIEHFEELLNVNPGAIIPDNKNTKGNIREIKQYHNLSKAEIAFVDEFIKEVLNKTYALEFTAFAGTYEDFSINLINFINKCKIV